MTGAPGRVCVVGSINIDTTYLVPSIPLAGETVLASGRAVAPGGKGANQAVAAAAMGCKVTFVGCVGDDPEGILAIASLAERGIDVSQLARLPGAATGTAAILVREDGENVITVDPGANRRLAPAVVAAHLASRTYDVVLAQLEIDVQTVVAAAKASGNATFILNPAPMSEDAVAMRELLRYADVLVPNRPELARLAGTPVPSTREELDDCVAQLGFDGILIVTLGADGVVVYEGEARARRATWIEPVSVQSVDTTGAGDAFCGVLAYVLAEGGDVVEAARRANEMAALSTTVAGARVPTDLLASAPRATHGAAVRAAGRPPESEAPVRPS